MQLSQITVRGYFGKVHVALGLPRLGEQAEALDRIDRVDREDAGNEPIDGGSALKRLR